MSVVVLLVMAAASWSSTASMPPSRMALATMHSAKQTQRFGCSRELRTLILSVLQGAENTLILSVTDMRRQLNTCNLRFHVTGLLGLKTMQHGMGGLEEHTSRRSDGRIERRCTPQRRGCKVNAHPIAIATLMRQRGVAPSQGP